MIPDGARVCHLISGDVGTLYRSEDSGLSYVRWDGNRGVSLGPISGMPTWIVPVEARPALPSILVTAIRYAQGKGIE